MQNKVTVFKTINSNIPLYYDVHEVLGSIKRGKNKQLIEKIRNEKDKEQRDRLKKQLYWICFSGEFKKRQNDELVMHSGLICLDFDNFPNKSTIDSWIGKLKNNKYCYSLFISPSGNGIKILVKIPRCITNDEHNLRFDSLAEEFSECEYFDKNGKGIVRVCYESYDPNLYINEESEEYRGIEKPKQRTRIDHATMFFDTETERIFEKLIVWFESKFSLKKGARNESLFYLFSACRDYNIPENTTMSLILNYASEKAEDFESIEKDLPVICKSAYSRPSANKKMILVPMSDTATDEDFSISDEDIECFDAEEPQLELVEEVIPEFPPETVIWKVTPTSIKIDFLKLKKFLQDEGFYRYEINERDFMFIRIIENTIQQCDVRHIKDFLLKCLEYWDKTDVYNMIAENAKFKKEYLNYLDPIKIEWNKDTKDCGWLYFNNIAVKVTKNKIELVNYIDLNGFIWKTQKINRNFLFKNESAANQNDFYTFIGNICNQDERRIDSMRSAIGYMLHGFKSKSTVKAIVLNDETISEEAMGGTGKGLIMQFIATLKNVVIIPGADFDTGKDFAWQRVSLDTDIVLIDDIERNFKQKKLFTFLTDGWPIRKLYQSEIFMRPEDSPKIVINTNYILKGDSDSYARRKFELELFPYYNKSHQPIDDFKKEFITEWTDIEKNTCDNYLIYCYKYFLNNGLVEPTYVNLKYKKLSINTSLDFVSFAEEYLNDNTKFNKKELFKQYQDQMSLTPHDYPNQKIFTQWLEYWATYNDFTFNSRFGSGGMFLIYGNGAKEWRKNNLPF